MSNNTDPAFGGYFHKHFWYGFSGLLFFKKAQCLVLHFPSSVHSSLDPGDDV